MITEINQIKNKKTIVFLPECDLDIKDSLKDTFQDIIIINYDKEEENIITTINNSKIEKIYLVGNNDFYRFLLPRLKKNIEVCWIFKNSFSDLSNGGVRYTLHCIFEFVERDLVESIGCLNEDNYKVFTNAGYKCEKINLQLNLKAEKYHPSNSIGILSNDFDPNNNFYNQLAALKFVDFDYCKMKYVMRASSHFCDFFQIKNKKLDNFDEIISDNFVNLYINFTNTNEELIKKSFNLGIPCILGNSNFFDKNKYLKEHLIVKSDDDINEIAAKINFAKNNREKIMEEYEKLFN